MRTGVLKVAIDLFLIVESTEDKKAGHGETRMCTR